MLIELVGARIQDGRRHLDTGRILNELQQGHYLRRDLVGHKFWQTTR